MVATARRMTATAATVVGASFVDLLLAPNLKDMRRSKKTTQRLQYPVSKEYTVNHIRDPTTI